MTNLTTMTIAQQIAAANQQEDTMLNITNVTPVEATKPQPPITFLDIPFPGDAKGGKAKYPFRDLEVGKMFFVEGGKIENLTNACTTWGKTLSATFKARKIEVGGVAGVGVWRIA